MTNWKTPVRTTDGRRTFGRRTSYDRRTSLGVLGSIWGLMTLLLMWTTVAQAAHVPAYVSAEIIASPTPDPVVVSLPSTAQLAASLWRDAGQTQEEDEPSEMPANTTIYWETVSVTRSVNGGAFNTVPILLPDPPNPPNTPNPTYPALSYSNSGVSVSSALSPANTPGGLGYLPCAMSATFSEEGTYKIRAQAKLVDTTTNPASAIFSR